MKPESSAGRERSDRVGEPSSSPASIVERLRELHAKTTPGPWVQNGHHIDARGVYIVAKGLTPTANAAFIAAAHNDLPSLLASHARMAEALRESMPFVESVAGTGGSGALTIRARKVLAQIRRALGEGQ